MTRIPRKWRSERRLETNESRQAGVSVVLDRVTDDLTISFLVYGMSCDVVDTLNAYEQRIAALEAEHARELADLRERAYLLIVGCLERTSPREDWSREAVATVACAVGNIPLRRPREGE